MKKLFLKSTALLISALTLSTSAMAADYWIDDVTVEAGKGTAAIDGVYNAAEWAAAEEISITLDNDPIVTQYGVYQGTWESARSTDDFSTKMYFMWDEDALYICELRSDDSVDLGGVGSAPWSGGDGNLIFIQTIDGGAKGNEEAWSHHIFYVVGDGTKSGNYGGDAYVRVCCGTKSSRETVKFDEIDIASAAIDGGFCVEIKVPWTVFGEKVPSFVPAEGVQIGMSLVPIDNDADGSNAQLCWVNQYKNVNATLNNFDFGGWATMTLAAAPVTAAPDAAAPDTADAASLALAALAASLAAGFVAVKSKKH